MALLDSTGPLSGFMVLLISRKLTIPGLNTAAQMAPNLIRIMTILGTLCPCDLVANGIKPGPSHLCHLVMSHSVFSPFLCQLTHTWRNSLMLGQMWTATKSTDAKMKQEELQPCFGNRTGQSQLSRCLANLMVLMTSMEHGRTGPRVLEVYTNYFAWPN